MNSKVAGKSAEEWQLTDRQRQVLEHLVTGASNKEIAEHLHCAVRTIELHVFAILQKSGCESRCEVVAAAWRRFVPEVA